MKDHYLRRLTVAGVALFLVWSVVSLGVAQAKAAGSVEDEGDALPRGQYIVVLKDAVPDAEVAEQELERAHGFKRRFVYRSAVKGFTAPLSKEALERVKRDPRVEFVSEDRIVTAVGKPNGSPAAQAPQTVPAGVRRVNAPANSNKGAGIGVAVIDTGIYLTHPDLAANIIANKNCLSSKKNGNDDNGHGTHVAGTIAALDNAVGVVGVAPQAKLLAVKVLNSQGSGTWSSVICGIDWVTQNAARYNIKVANMSLGGTGTSDSNCGATNGDALHRAICRSRDAGVTYVVAAGNNAANSNSFVPAAYDDAVVTVSALADSNGAPGGTGPATPNGPDDTFATFSNYGSVVDLGAPGVNILSTWKGGTYATLSGTSMASPHAAGAVALYIKSHPGALWTSVRDALRTAGEALGFGHTDPSGLHPEPVLQAGLL
ncbi:MAG: S8 family peptidase [bacterium]|nr:S8 family peptidase [bacterium]